MNLENKRWVSTGTLIPYESNSGKEFDNIFGIINQHTYDIEIDICVSKFDISYILDNELKSYIDFCQEIISGTFIVKVVKVYYDGYFVVNYALLSNNTIQQPNGFSSIPNIKNKTIFKFSRKDDAMLFKLTY